MRRLFGFSLLTLAVALGINLMAANEKPSDAMKAVMNGNTAANAAVREAAKAGNAASSMPAAMRNEKSCRVMLRSPAIEGPTPDCSWFGTRADAVQTMKSYFGSRLFVSLMFIL